MSRHPDPHAKIELLRAAEAVFAEKGLAAAKIEDITARAGVSKGAFYLHFESKDDCFRQIVEAFLAHMAARVEPPPAVKRATASSPTEALEACLAHDRDILEFCWQSRSTFKLLFDGAGGSTYAYLLDEFSERLAVSAAEWIEDARASGLYRPDIDAKVLALLLAGAYERLARAIVRQPKRPDIEAWARQAQVLFARGMMTESARADLDRPVIHGRSDARAAPAAEAARAGGGRAARKVGADDGPASRRRPSSAPSEGRATGRTRRGRST